MDRFLNLFELWAGSQYDDTPEGVRRWQRWRAEIYGQPVEPEPAFARQIEVERAEGEAFLAFMAATGGTRPSA